MKKIISVLLCVVFLFSAFSFNALGAKEENKTTETTEFLLELDINERYTDIDDDTDGLFGDDEEGKGITKGQKTVYIAVLVSALVVSVVILAVSLKRVPNEEDIDISGENKKRKNKEE